MHVSAPGGVGQVVQYTLAPHMVEYMHRVGRTARAGRTGRSVSLVDPGSKKDAALVAELQVRLKVPRSSDVPSAEHVGLARRIRQHVIQPSTRPRASGLSTSSRARRARASNSSPRAWSTMGILRRQSRRRSPRRVRA